MNTPKVYTQAQWREISTFPIEFFQMYVSLIDKKNRKTLIDMDKIVNKKMKVDSPFTEEALYDLFDGDISGLIIAYIMKNQHLFIVDMSSESV